MLNKTCLKETVNDNNASFLSEYISSNGNYDDKTNLVNVSSIESNDKCSVRRGLVVLFIYNIYLTWPNI